MNPDLLFAEKYKKATNIIAILILAAFAVYLAINWNNIPDTIPTHYNALNVPDDYGSKGTLIVITVVATLIVMVLAIVECFPQGWNYPVKVTDENRTRLMIDGIKLVGSMKVLIAMMFVYMGFCSANSINMSWPMYAMLLLILTVIIAGIVRMFKDR